MPTGRKAVNSSIVWTPGVDEAGELYYTCTVLSHTGMTGRIRVEN